MTRRTHIALLTSAAATVSPVFGKDNTVLIAILQASQNEKKGVSLYLRGQTLAGIVVKIEGDVVELRSREFSRILVRLESIDGAALASV